MDEFLVADPTRPACMGGWCERRGWCLRYRQADRSAPSERLCRGRMDAFVPLNVDSLPLLSGTFRAHGNPLDRATA